MTIRFQTFFMGVMIMLVLMLLEIAGGAYYHQLRRSRSAQPLTPGAHVPAAAVQITTGITR